jgi:hypothetical protein
MAFAGKAWFSMTTTNPKKAWSISAEVLFSFQRAQICEYTSAWKFVITSE